MVRIYVTRITKCGDFDEEIVFVIKELKSLYWIDQAADILEFFNNDPRVGNQTKSDPGFFQRRIQTGELSFNDIFPMATS